SGTRTGLTDPYDDLIRPLRMIRPDPDARPRACNFHLKDLRIVRGQITTSRFGVSNSASNVGALPGSTSRKKPSTNSVGPSTSGQQTIEAQDDVERNRAPRTGTGGSPPVLSEMKTMGLSGLIVFVRCIRLPPF